MDNTPASIEIPSLHTPEMIREEMEAMLDESPERPRLTMGALLRLWLTGSPFIHGGDISEDDLCVAQGILGGGWPASEIVLELSCALRALEIIPRTQGDGASASNAGICPEWACDIYAAACQVSPSMSWEAFLHRLPLALLFHLVAASVRQNGGRTARPADWTAALKGLTGFYTSNTARQPGQ